MHYCNQGQVIILDFEKLTNTVVFFVLRSSWSMVTKLKKELYKLNFTKGSFPLTTQA